MKNWGRLIGSLYWPEGATAWIMAVGQGSFVQRGRWWKNAPKNKAWEYLWTGIHHPMDPNTEKVLKPQNYSKLYPKHFLRRYGWVHRVRINWTIHSELGRHKAKTLGKTTQNDLTPGSTLRYAIVQLEIKPWQLKLPTENPLSMEVFQGKHHP
jgi:hypothetical protein